MQKCVHFHEVLFLILANIIQIIAEIQYFPMKIEFFSCINCENEIYLPVPTLYTYV
jgi:hypothetical protein